MIVGSLVGSCCGGAATPDPTCLVWDVDEVFWDADRACWL
jgi:hypothetical protein